MGIMGYQFPDAHHIIETIACIIVARFCVLISPKLVNTCEVSIVG